MADGRYSEDPKRVDALNAWLRAYASERVNSRLIDERRAIPPHVVLDFAEAGLFGLQVGDDASTGRRRFSYGDTVKVYEQLAAIDLTLATLVSSHANGPTARRRAPRW